MLEEMCVVNAGEMCVANARRNVCEMLEEMYVANVRRNVW